MAAKLLGGLVGYAKDECDKEYKLGDKLGE